MSTSGSIYPPQSGSNQNFFLQKQVISNQRAKDILAGTFNEVIISEEKFDDEKIKLIYNGLFYQIPKKGIKSHTSIIEQSIDFIYPEINKNFEDKISAIEEELIDEDSDCGPLYQYYIDKCLTCNK